MQSAPSSLSDLSLAVFLESLYTLEIAPNDVTPSGINPNHEQRNEAPKTSPNEAMLPLAPESADYAESALIDNNLVYSVPSDLSWWDLAWSLPKQEELTPSDYAMPQEDTSPSSAPAEDRNQFQSSHYSLSAGTPSSATHVQSRSCCSSRSVNQPSKTEAMQPLNDHDKVHCVPNPKGLGCSCLCGSDVALLSLQRSLGSGSLADGRDQHKMPSEADVASSLVFTLSMSQAITKKCACSADCPTCKKDPSSEVSAGLLISTALQIYARALKVFQEVLVPNRQTKKCTCLSSQPLGSCHCVCEKRRMGKGPSSDDSGVDVRIGDFCPTSQNARKIALYAMKLELFDLEKALAHVQEVSQRSLPPLTSSTNDTPSSSAASCCASKNNPSAQKSQVSSSLRLNPIDQLIIKKLHIQLGEVLQTVENLETSQDQSVQ